jgi:transcription termination/antitermination protein NusG
MNSEKNHAIDSADHSSADDKKNEPDKNDSQQEQNLDGQNAAMSNSDGGMRANDGAQADTDEGRPGVTGSGEASQDSAGKHERSEVQGDQDVIDQKVKEQDQTAQDQAGQDQADDDADLDETWEGDVWDEEDGDENASPLEEFVDEPIEAVDESEMKWYILKVQVNRESSICEALQRRVKLAGMETLFGEILVPTEDVREFTKSGRQRIVKKKLYPGYIVVRMVINDETWFLVRETAGIGDFTGAVGKPAPLETSEVERIIASTRIGKESESGEEIKVQFPYKTGDRVRVKEGYFQNHEGEVSAIDERNGRITVMINIFGRPNPVELDHWHVEFV